MARRQDSLGRFVRAEGAPAPLPAPEGKTKRGPAAFKHFRVDAVLSPTEREAYERLLADPNSTVASLQAWLGERGHRVCRTAVARHRRSFAADLTKLREAARMAQTFCAISRQAGGAGAIAEAAHARFEMLLMRKLFEMQDSPVLAPGDWQVLGKTVRSAVQTRQNVEEMRADLDAKTREAAAEAARQEPVDGVTVVNRVREMLGMPPVRLEQGSAAACSEREFNAEGN